MDIDETQQTKGQAVDVVIFGGTGDLAKRKLLPALYHLNNSGWLGEGSMVLGVSRGHLDSAAFKDVVCEACTQHVDAEYFSSAAWESFASKLQYLSLDAANQEAYGALADCLQQNGSAGDRVRVFYLATSPDLFVPICQSLAAVNLVTPKSRVVLEKPLGHNLASARLINQQVGEVFRENQIFRIDHYLGKEAVQNLIALRFANAFFEPLWGRTSVSHVQITLAESLGVEGRGAFYDKTGAMRDMVQNHLLQLLCIIAMEPPISIQPTAVRNEKLKVLQALKPLIGDEALRNSVRGQYRAGTMGGAPVPSYVDESNVPDDSTTETFVAVRAEINTWRWAGVPFYLRTGKRLAHHLSEVTVTFRQVPHLIFGSSRHMTPNRLVIRLQPDEGIKLGLMVKAPGERMRLRSVALNLNFAETFKARQVDAYERLLMDVLRGDLTLFIHRDEQDAAWTWVEPIMAAWAASEDMPRPYPAGSWGPPSASALIARDNFSWFEEA